MPVRSCFYDVVQLPSLTPEQTSSFEDLPPDPYCGGGQRWRRFSQYQLLNDDESWTLDLLPHRPFIQSKKYNPYVGGVARHLDPVLINPADQIAAAADLIGLDRSEVWQVNVHQCRVRANDDIAGTSVPEGPHRDGHEIGMVVVFDRHNISGGTTQLLRNDPSEVYFEVVLESGQAIVYDDSATQHFATDIVALDESGGHRDLWIVAFNRWPNRRYGSEFEAEALGSAE